MSADSTILVAVSGSPASLSALRWAANEAGRRECRLSIVLVWQCEIGASYARHADRPDRTKSREHAWSVLTEAVRAELGPGPWRSTTVQAIEGKTEQALVAASEDADLLVLGSSQAGMIGPVVRTCLTNAHCPVLVVTQRARPPQVGPPAAGLVSQRAVAAASR